MPASEIAGEDNLSVSAAYSDYSTLPVVDHAETFSTVMPLAKLEKRNNLHSRPSSQLKSYGVIEMMILQIQQQAIQHQHDWEEKAE
jgi:hypothetical protein